MPHIHELVSGIAAYTYTSSSVNVSSAAFTVQVVALHSKAFFPLAWGKIFHSSCRARKQKRLRRHIKTFGTCKDEIWTRLERRWGVVMYSIRHACAPQLFLSSSTLRYVYNAKLPQLGLCWSRYSSVAQEEQGSPRSRIRVTTAWDKRSKAPKNRM